MYLDSAAHQVRPLLQLLCINQMHHGCETDNAMAQERLDAPKHVTEVPIAIQTLQLLLVACLGLTSSMLCSPVCERSEQALCKLISDRLGSSHVAAALAKDYAKQ